MLSVECFLPVVGKARCAVPETQRSVGVSELRGHPITSGPTSILYPLSSVSPGPPSRIFVFISWLTICAFDS
jgi:hypothetical protein